MRKTAIFERSYRQVKDARKIAVNLLVQAGLSVSENPALIKLADVKGVTFHGDQFEVKKLEPIISDSGSKPETIIFATNPIN